MNRVIWFLPAAFLVIVVMLYPAVHTFVLTFYQMNLANSLQAEFSGLDNMVRLGLDSRFHGTLWTTTVFTVLSVSIEFMAGLLLALAVDTWIRGRGAVRTILLIPWTLPTAVIAVLWGWIFNDQYGILNSVLMRSSVPSLRHLR